MRRTAGLGVSTEIRSTGSSPLLAFRRQSRSWSGSGFAAESVDHHPDLLINYKRVTVTFSTHSEGGLTEKDFDGARSATEIAAAGGAK